MTACNKTVPVNQLIKLNPPTELLLFTEKPDWLGTDNGDLIDYVLELQEAINSCNQDKQKLITWFE